MTPKEKAAARMRDNGYVETGLVGKYAVLGWYGNLAEINQGALAILPTVEWEENHIVGVYKYKSSALRAMRSKSRLLGIGDGTYYQLAIYLNAPPSHGH